MTTEPGPLASEKLSETSEPGQPEPQTAETESARLLANQAGPALRDAGLTDEEIRRLADEYIACDFGEGLPEFVAWARSR
jgi:hypothetical protein